MRQRLALLVLLIAASLAAPNAAPQRGSKPAPDVPPVSMTCPMHPDVVDSTPGSCPICKMSLVPVRLESVWTCPVHAVVAADHAGVCPIDHRDLIQVTMAVTFTCAGHPEINQIEPGICADGKPMIKARTLRPHGNHNPQYGGQFFMAPDNTHHLEGVLPRARLFRLYLYDDYARPLPADQINAVKARVVTNENFDPATRTTTEVAAFPLVRAGRGYLEARIDTARLPAQLSAKVKFKSDAPEYRFDFTFTELSKKPGLTPAAAPASTLTVRKGTSAAAPAGRTAPPSANAPASAIPVPAATPDAAAPPPAAPGDPVAAPATLPVSVPEILDELKARHREIGELVDRGAFAAVWVPAFRARDLSIALESRLNDLPAAARGTAAPAIKRLVQTAWLLDAFGDVGNRQQIVDAYAIFGAAVDDVVSAFK